jgi:hypothetical protein
MMEMAGEIFSGTSFRLGETSSRDNSLRKIILWKNTPAPALPPQRDPSVKKRKRIHPVQPNQHIP